MQDRCRQFRRTSRSQVFIKHLLCSGHQAAKAFCISLSDQLQTFLNVLFIDPSQVFLNFLLCFVLCKWIAAVQICQNLDGIFSSLQIRKHKIQIRAYLNIFYRNTVTIKSHQHGLLSIGTGLIQFATAGRRSDLTFIGKIHLSPGIQMQMIDLIECAGDQNTDSCTGRKAFFHRQSHMIDHDPDTAHIIALLNGKSSSGYIAKKAAFFCDLLQGFCFHVTGENQIGI